MSAVEGPLLGVVLAGVAALEGVAVFEAAIVAVDSFQLIATRLYTFNICRSRTSKIAISQIRR
jgi:hypothetical protein